MSSLLIHSMTEFSDIILRVLHAAGARTLAEVGAEFGGTSQQLAAYAQATGGSLTSIDPCPKQEFLDWVASSPSVDHVAAPSLEAMPGCKDIDAWVIDGDHNYYTVSNEMRIAGELAKRDGKPLLALLHDVSWPCGRRDFYYAPDRIPAEWLHPHSFDAGVTLDNPAVLDNRGFRGAGQFAVALHEGGPRNGVLTAVEDFLAEERAKGADLAFAFVPAVFGLGIVFDATAPWAPEVAQIVLPYHDNALIASLERNRLRNYLAVIDWQDRQAA
ncbi:class I SAM-dependent methyltransferase [Sphingomonas gei]|uniref:Class I SAM-dependent methyltransferase n=1 Tax=Sphingomonas gei TaxID=1395960 RepID=A0A4S1XDR5_9SPHN|nr:class I SAM-dependent methyltransferase [Sphingomonas gei]TGX54231.1 class I SAM-dependent methyltransferase [Sphingomonas gei]